MSQDTSQQFLITLTETCQVILSSSPKWLKNAVYKNLQGRWTYLRDKYISEHSEDANILNMKKGSLDAYDVYEVRSALPYTVAFTNVQKWIPWALNEIRKEFDETVEYMYSKGIVMTKEAIAAGANSPEYEI